MRPDERDVRLEAVRLAVQVYRETLPYVSDSASLRGEVLTLAKAYLDFIEDNAPTPPPVIVNISSPLTAGAAEQIAAEIKKAQRKAGR